jgi:tRNA (Thr-GGU) A37 N-methylase
LITATGNETVVTEAGEEIQRSGGGITGGQGARLSVRGLDCFDGTPILDLKGYQPDYRAQEFSLPDWYQRLMDESGHV